jgi:hypothetical protein
MNEGRCMLIRILLLIGLYCTNCTAMSPATIGGTHDIYEEGGGDYAVPCPVDGVIGW